MVQLHHGWLVSARNTPVPVSRVPAAVPGCVHTDLLAAGLIPDPFLDANENELSWIGRTRWMYETSFQWSGPVDDRIDLVCAGLDTVATISLNGTEVGRTANMHRGYRFDLRSALTPGRNDLRIAFDSPYEYTAAMARQVGSRPGAYDEPYNLIRKMACNFGWDWGPTVVTAGIWQPIGLHSWSTARLAQVRPQITVDGTTGVVDVHVDVERASTESLHVTVEVGGVVGVASIGAGSIGATLRLSVPDVRRWWPRGHGEQPLYPLRVVLATEGGRELDRWERRVGFRTVRVDTTPDEHGTPYTVLVNDKPVFVKGVNWIPDDAFVTRITRERLAERFRQACDANINYLRVWGGGRYESEDFYELADEMGLMVGQDFLFACAAYPEEEPFAAEVAAEAREHVVRLASHPSLVTWTGNNENIWGFADWGWPEQLAGRSWGAGYYHELLPSIVAELDPTRPYWPGSPWSGTPDLHPNDPAHGTMHIWDVWNQVDYTHYRDYTPRFVAEFGFQAPPAYATLRRALRDDPLASDSPGMRHHQKAADGDLKLRRGLDAHLPEPHDFADWHYLTQVNQARAIQLAVEHFRSHQPVCMGAIVWQLNDCWPVTSWAAIDGDGRRKPLWHALRAAYADRLLTIQPRDGGLVLVASNDTDQPWQAEASVTSHDLSGKALAATTVDLDVAARSVTVTPLPDGVALPEEPRSELLRAVAGEQHAWWFHAEDREIDYPAARFDVNVEPTTGGYDVTVTAGTILRDLSLFPDRLDPAATVDQALVTLLPGESVTFTVHSTAPLDAAALAAQPVLRCVNDISAQRHPRRS
ncbi:glycoside hydrolase family 2 protein [Catellatospora sichuanensis]|uniref:glycoside hydrolase family 2 protein n=1 Tax=Catellatospora sichuanensis TaxID=1969805 RepID=UPI001FE4D1FE|nr:glycoside hydrolase family 2 TIM barrel-domain containing protein [Catellatospora sichuanensis]